MNAILLIVQAVAIPLGVLNLLGGIVSGIWLAILGEWGTIGIGLLVGFIATSVLGFALIPAMLLAAPAIAFEEKGNQFGIMFCSILGAIYTIGVMTVWCLGVLFFFGKGLTDANFIPTLIWSYGVAIGPWSYMASKEAQGGSGEFYSLLLTFFAEIGYVAIILFVLFSSITAWQAVKIFLSFMVIAFMIQLAVFRTNQKLEREVRGVEY